MFDGIPLLDKVPVWRLKFWMCLKHCSFASFCDFCTQIFAPYDHVTHIEDHAHPPSAQPIPRRKYEPCSSASVSARSTGWPTPSQRFNYVKLRFIGLQAAAGPSRRSPVDWLIRLVHAALEYLMATSDDRLT